VLAKELEDKVFAMKAGEITDVIRTKQGFVILKVTEHQEAGIPTLKEAEPRIQDALYMQKLQPALRAYLTKLREDAYIDIKSGYLDSGASAKQTKPIETTAKDVTAKKLRKKKKLGVF
jgi:peptidyl-prolyl cis-trans isomerase SurA